MQKANYFDDSKIYNLKEHLCSRFEEELQTQEYLDSNQITEILFEGVKKYLGVNIKNLEGVRIYNPLWWTFVTPNYSAIVPINGSKAGMHIYSLKEHLCSIKEKRQIQENGRKGSGMYRFNEKDVEVEFKKYKEDIKNRISRALED